MQRARAPALLRREIGKFARQLGFDRFAYALRITVPSLPAKHYALTDYPREWGERYVAHGYFGVDPIVLHCERSSLPAFWDEDIFHGRESEPFWEDARSYGLRSGVTLAVHEFPGAVSVFSLSRDRSLDVEGDELAALIGRVHVFAAVLHQSMIRLKLPLRLPRPIRPLTAREGECLKWTAAGKTAWEIGCILGITERTVVFHLGNGAQKLGAANKTQAVVRAVALRLV